MVEMAPHAKFFPLQLVKPVHVTGIEPSVVLVQLPDLENPLFIGDYFNDQIALHQILGPINFASERSAHGRW